MRTALATLVLAGCFQSPPAPPDDVEAQRGACTALEGVQFESLTEQECGLTPDGVARCHWHITLDSADRTRSRVEWRYSDVIESGAVTCDGPDVQWLEGPRAPGVAGRYDAASGQLTWNGVVYIHGS